MAADKTRYKAICHTVREDGAYVEAGENDNLIVQKLDTNPKALGVFGFSFLDQNRDKIQSAAIDGVTPEFETISDGSYPISRPLYFYVKAAHAEVIPGISGYLAEFTSDTVPVFPVATRNTSLCLLHRTDLDYLLEGSAWLRQAVHRGLGGSSIGLATLMGFLAALFFKSL